MTHPEPAAHQSQVPAIPDAAEPTEVIASPAVQAATTQLPEAPLPPAAAHPVPMQATPVADELSRVQPEPADLPIDPRDTALAAAVTTPTAQYPAAQQPVAPGRHAAPTAEASAVQAPGTEAPAAPGQPVYPQASAPVPYPATAYPVSSVPVSAYPVSAYPTSGYGYPGAPVAQPKRPVATIVLSVATGLLVLVLGVITTLFVLKSIELTDTRKELTGQVGERDDKIKLNTSEIDRLKTQVQQTKDELAVAKRDLEGSENAGKELAAAKAALTECLEKLTDFLAAPTQAKINALDVACEAADQYM